jgi:ankyrin repeat protein
VTPLKFAIEKLETAGDSPDAKAQRLDMVRLLLSLGAKPDSALKDACASNNSEIIGVLLEGGVNPNAKDEEGTPAFFFCEGDAAAVEKLRLLAAKGADFNALDAKGEGALIRAATFSQWEKMLFFVDHDVRDTARVNGKNAAARVAQAIEDDKQNSRETSPALRQLAAKLSP